IFGYSGSAPDRPSPPWQPAQSVNLALPASTSGSAASDVPTTMTPAPRIIAATLTLRSCGLRTSLQRVRGWNLPRSQQGLDQLLASRPGDDANLAQFGHFGAGVSLKVARELCSAISVQQPIEHVSQVPV